MTLDCTHAPRAAARCCAVAAAAWPRPCRRWPPARWTRSSDSGKLTLRLPRRHAALRLHRRGGQAGRLLGGAVPEGGRRGQGRAEAAGAGRRVRAGDGGQPLRGAAAGPHRPELRHRHADAGAPRAWSTSRSRSSLPAPARCCAPTPTAGCATRWPAGPTRRSRSGAARRALLTENVVFAVVGGTTIEKSLIDAPEGAAHRRHRGAGGRLRGRRADGARPPRGGAVRRPAGAARRGQARPGAGELLVLERTFTREPLALAHAPRRRRLPPAGRPDLEPAVPLEGHRRRCTPATSARRTPARWSSSSPWRCPIDSTHRRIDDASTGCTQRSRQAAHGDGLPPRPGASAPDAGQRRRTAVRRRALGAGGAEGPLRLRAEDARARHRGASTCTRCWPRRWTTRPRATGCSTGASPSTTSASAWPPTMRPGSTRCRRAKLAEHLIGGIAVLDLPKSEMLVDADRGLRRHRLPHPAGAEHAVPARPVLLDLQGRDLQPDVLAGAPARDAAAARGLQVPPALQGRRLHDLVGRLRRALRRVHDRRRRRHADRQGRGADRHGRAHHAPGGLPAGRAAVQAGRRDPRDRLPDAEEPRRDAPGHGVQLLRPRPGDRLPRGGRPDPLLQRAARRQGRHRGASRRRATCSTWCASARA